MRTTRLIDLFAGCGGISAGFRATGRFETAAAVEIDLQAAATYALNFGDHVFVGDVAEWACGSMPRAEIVVGGPPCQGFSGLGARDPDDPRNKLWRHYVTVLLRARPTFFVIENVPQFLKSAEFKQLQAETAPCGRLGGYALEPYLLNAADYGAAQARRRAIVFGRRREIRRIGPPPPRGRRTLREVLPEWLDGEVCTTDIPRSSIEFRGVSVPGPFKLRDLHFTRNPDSVSRARYKAVPPGGNRFDLPSELQTPGWRKHKTGASDVMGRLRWDTQSVTIRTEFFKPEKGRYLHPSADRPITHAEAALIQGFPESFQWCGSKAAIARQIGNAVPIPLAQAIAEHISEFMPR